MFAAAAVFDYTVTFGNLITVATIVTAIWVSSTKITARLVKIETEYDMKMGMLWKWYCSVHGINGGDIIKPAKPKTPLK